jgi:hypothetical protein
MVVNISQCPHPRAVLVTVLAVCGVRSLGSCKGRIQFECIERPKMRLCVVYTQCTQGVLGCRVAERSKQGQLLLSCDYALHCSP